MENKLIDKEFPNPENLIAEAFSVIYQNSSPPEGIFELFRLRDKPGKICAIFYHGRSGSFFCQSFFSDYEHAQVITVPPHAMVDFELVISEGQINEFNEHKLATWEALKSWCDQLLQCFPYMYEKLDTQPGLDKYCTSRVAYSKLFYAQMLLIEQGSLTYEILLKIFFISYRLSKKGTLDWNRQLIFLWQAHVPSYAHIPERKKWILKTFKDSLLLTVVRFPEKALDSHLMHHAYETISPPIITLFHRLCFDHLANDSKLSGDSNSDRECVIRFEDLHHHPEFVLKALCNWFEVPYSSELVKTSFTYLVNGVEVTGARRLKISEFEPKMLDYYDLLRIRFLLQEEYLKWGYASFCNPSFEQSILFGEAFMSHIFHAYTVLASLSEEPKNVVLKEASRLEQSFGFERERRNSGISITPLLYCLNEVPSIVVDDGGE